MSAMNPLPAPSPLVTKTRLLRYVLMSSFGSLGMLFAAEAGSGVEVGRFVDAGELATAPPGAGVEVTATGAGVEVMAPGAGVEGMMPLGAGADAMASACACL